MFRVEVTTALGIITMNFFFHFNRQPGPALAMLLSSWFSSSQQLQEWRIPLHASAGFTFPDLPVSSYMTLECSLLFLYYLLPQMIKWA